MPLGDATTIAATQALHAAAQAVADAHAAGDARAEAAARQQLANLTTLYKTYVTQGTTIDTSSKTVLEQLGEALKGAAGLVAVGVAAYLVVTHRRRR